MTKQSSHSTRKQTQNRFLVLLVIAISALFVWMIWDFLMTMLLAAIVSGMVHPLYRRLNGWFRGRRAVASVTTVVATLILIIGPLSAFLGVVAGEAIEVSRTMGPQIREFLTEPTSFDRIVETLPFVEELAPYKDELLTRLGTAAQRIGEFFFDSVAAATAGTAIFFFHLFIMLYAMFFFLIHGKSILDRIMYYAPMPLDQQDLMIRKFVSVSRATIKGTLVIGVVQGGLAGLAFAVVGIKSATFWGTIMVVLSIIPALGTALVWVPAVIWLLATGEIVEGLGLLIWCTVVVATVDNFLRPYLVGRDTQMPDLLVLLGTLGGLTLFGAIGIMIGPVVAALFITVWELYGEAYKDILTEKRQPKSITSTSVDTETAEVVEEKPA